MSFPYSKVKYFLPKCSKNAIFELPTLLAPKEGGASKLDGIHRKSNFHAWIEIANINLYDCRHELMFKHINYFGLFKFY